MLCPVDGENLVMSDRNGVEIDYCPKCRGVWLDRGELDKIIDRSALASAPVSTSRGAAPVSGQRGAAPVYHPEPRSRNDHDDDRPRGKRRESFLSDIFDF